MRSPDYTLQRPIDLSLDPEAKYSPLGENTTLKTILACPRRVLIFFCEDTLHKIIVLFLDPDTKHFPHGENPTLYIGL